MKSPVIRSLLCGALACLPALSTFAQAPAPAATAAQVGPFLLHFEASGSDIGPLQEGILENAAEIARTLPDATLIVIGNAESSEARNVELSFKRAQAVRAYLMQHGVDSARLFISGAGTRSPLVAPDGSGAPQPENRYVVIQFQAR